METLKTKVIVESNDVLPEEAVKLFNPNQNFCKVQSS